MWVFNNNSFVSAVEHRSDPSMLVVRARAEGDLERFFIDGEKITVEVHPERDYLFRTIVEKSRFAKVLVQHALGISYPNFKGSIANGDEDRHDAYLNVWSAMYTFQRWMSEKTKWPKNPKHGAKGTA